METQAQNPTTVKEPAQTQVQTQTTHQTTASQFDPSSLSPEAMAWVDRQRTQAAQTARENTRKNLLKDESFLAEVRQSMQPQVQQTIEQQMQGQISDLNKRLAVSEVTRILSGANIPNDQMSTYVELFADEDIDKSIGRATNFVSAFTTSLKAYKDAQQQQAVQNMTTPQTAVTSVSEQQALQARLDEARKNTNPRVRDVYVSSIIREASEKGIILK